MTDQARDGRPPKLLIVVGLNREAALVRDRAEVRVGSSGLAAAIGGHDGVISFGLCGALDTGLAVGDLIVANGVVAGDARFAADEAWAAALRAALPGARAGDMAGVDRIAATVAAKAALRSRTGALGVDMESHAVARAAGRAGAPFAVVRAVSDGADRDLPRAAQAGFTDTGDPDVLAVIRTLAGRPWELPALIRTAREARIAFEALARAAAALAPPPR